MTTLGIDASFFADYWRQRPVVLHGAAQELLTMVPPTEALVELRTLPGIDCSTDGHTVWFYQQLVEQLPITERLTRDGQALFEWPEIACDLVLTEGPASIGCHYDEGDNLSIQLTGTKRWRLSPPDTLPADEVRQRMLKEPDLGKAELGPEVTEFVLGPGDILYIPQTWIHWGESSGDSLSISLVINNRTFHQELSGGIADALRRVPDWVRSVPVGPGSAAARERATDELVSRTFHPPVADRVRPRLIRKAPVPSLTMDMPRVKAFIASAPPLPTADFVLPGASVQTHRVLRALLARRTLRQLLRVIAKRHGSTCCATDRILYQQCVDALLDRSDTELERLCTEPELVSLASIAPDGETRYEDPLAAELARAVVPELCAAGSESVPFTLLPDLDGSFTLRRSGLRLAVDEPRDDLVMRVVDGAAQIFVDGRFRDPSDAPGIRVAPLARLLDRGPHLTPAATAWVARNVRDQPLFAADDEQFSIFTDAVRSGAECLAAAWPEAWDEVADGMRWLLPLPDRGLAPLNYSVHAFRGLVVTSPRRDHRSAQTLVHEWGHNRLSTILDLVELCDNPSEVVISPVVDAPRPMSFVFHGCFAFAQDVALTERLLAHDGTPVAEQASMERYLDDVRRKATSALDVLEGSARTTAVGAVLCEEIAQVVRA